MATTNGMAAYGKHTGKTREEQKKYEDNWNRIFNKQTAPDVEADNEE